MVLDHQADVVAVWVGRDVMEAKRTQNQNQEDSGPPLTCTLFIS